VLLRVEVTVPFALPRTRCALTAPFHPYLFRSCPRPSAVRSLWPCSSPRGGRALPVTLPCGARTFLYARHVQVALSGLFRAQRLPGQLRRGW